MDEITNAKKVTPDTVDLKKAGKYPLLVQAHVEGKLVKMYYNNAEREWFGDEPDVEKAKEIYERLHDDMYLEDNHSYVFKLTDEGLICIAVLYGKDGAEDFGQIITLGLMGELTTPKLYNASDMVERAVQNAKEDEAKGLLLHYYDGTYELLQW